MVWLISIILIIWLFSVIADKAAKSEEREKRKRLLENETEEDRVLRLVEEKKARFKELNLEELILKLFFYKSYWLSNPPNKAFSLITKVELPKKEDSNEGSFQTKFILKGREFILNYGQRGFSVEGDYFTHGEFEFCVSGKKVLFLNISIEPQEYFTKYSVFKIDAFIEGDWIRDLKELEIQIDKKEEDDKLRQKYNPEKINKLKEGFGL